ncbi:hypothetical protein [Maridesulfovibrio sp.]|uniref:hypothetical protein n=1 Tax=Maridesulfovibrio sp. TaxID=2795000 RepID=UPI0029C9BB8F|nr:hypothetical protein [Maridesulfovibrio sp.]
MDLSWIEEIEVTDQNAEQIGGVVTSIAALAGVGVAPAALIGLGVQLGLKCCNGGYKPKGLEVLQELAAEIEAYPELTVE